MSELLDNSFLEIAQERVGSMPTPITKGVDGVGKTIPPELDERAARMTALNMLQIINRLPNIEVGTFQTNTNQG